MPGLSDLIEFLEGSDAISPDFAEASNHSAICRCDKCRQWWIEMGPDPDTRKFGPFGDELWEDYTAEHDATVDEAKSWTLQDDENTDAHTT